MKNKEFTIQELLSLGYIYLIILGIITDVIYYNFVGINIFKYSTVLDVLITPISIITTNIVTLCVFIVTISFLYYLTTNLIPKLHFKCRDQKWYQKTNNIEKLDKLYGNYDLNKKLIQLAYVIFFMFLGFGSFRGMKLKSRIENGDITTTHSIIFNDGIIKDVKIIGQNSSYIFYITKNQQGVSVSPINFNIKEIRRVSN